MTYQIIHFFISCATLSKLNLRNRISSDTRMEGIIIDAIKFRINEHNARVIEQCKCVAAATCNDMIEIVGSYLGNQNIKIDINIAAACVHARYATFAGHTLTFNMPDRDMEGFIGYHRKCINRCCDDRWYDLDLNFDWSDYIEFILTGFNEHIFSITFTGIKLYDQNGSEKYTPCCADGDARPLSVRLLADLRSQILNSAR